MDIVVCVKRVAASDSKIKVAGNGTAADTAGVEFVLNEYDKFALEEALKTKEALGKGTVTVVSLGPPDTTKILQTCLAMGADKAVLIKDAGVAHDACSTAEVLAAWLKTVPHQVVFCGKQAIDQDNSQVGPRLGALLELGSVTEVVKLTRESEAFLCERDIEGAREIVRVKVPCVITTQKGLNEPRTASLKGIMAAKTKPLVQVDAAPVQPATRVVALSLPPDRPPGKVWKDGVASVPALIAALKNEAKVL